MGSANDYAIVDPPTPAPRLTLVNGGHRRIWAYAVLYHPTLVKETVPIRVKALESRQWSYELSFTTPRSLRVVAGVPISAPNRVSFKLGGKRYAKRYLTSNRRCPERGFRRYEGSFSYMRNDFSQGSTGFTGRIACR